ncbi:MAG: hypothetical protein DHS80DRAFT_32582 [Piptocephalis tieghemiana]|nr:MAG: hypothetical protein DHS80DRAFT_32582 [Piptocephalis tieghemiana]
MQKSLGLLRTCLRGIPRGLLSSQATRSFPSTSFWPMLSPAYARLTTPFPIHTVSLYTTPSLQQESSSRSQPEVPKPPLTLEPSDHPAGHLNISQRAVQKLSAILAKETHPEAALRILVDSGGCHGYQYRLELSQSITAEDVVLEKDGARVVVDEVSLPLMSGSTVDYQVELIGSMFKIVNNPLASSTCGCDVSFEIK